MSGMSRCLKDLLRIIEDHEELEICKQSDKYIVIKDDSFGDDNLEIAISNAPFFAVQLAIRITKSLDKNPSDKLLAAHEYLLALTTSKNITLLYNKETKTFAIAVSFRCFPYLTDLNEELETALDELRCFLEEHGDEVRDFLSCNGLQ